MITLKKIIKAVTPAKGGVQLHLPGFRLSLDFQPIGYADL
jgi:hypothetical protein